MLGDGFSQYITNASGYSTAVRHPSPHNACLLPCAAGVHTRFRLSGLAYDALTLLHQLGVFLMVLAVQVGWMNRALRAPC
jgi:hypothetical protein